LDSKYDPISDESFDDDSVLVLAVVDGDGGLEVSKVAAVDVSAAAMKMLECDDKREEWSIGRRLLCDASFRIADVVDDVDDE
jgi:serine/threonine protein phosphatase PrpC